MRLTGMAENKSLEKGSPVEYNITSMERLTNQGQEEDQCAGYLL